MLQCEDAFPFSSQEHLQSLLSEGYKWRDCCVALKVTANDHWSAIQFLGRYVGNPPNKEYIFNICLLLSPCFQ